MKERAAVLQSVGWAFLILVMVGVVVSAIRSTLRKHAKPEQLQILGTVPDFSLTERSSRPITLMDLRDKLWIANFIYTACRETCPLQSAQMAKLQMELADRKDIRLVSFSVDPERDTPAVLSEYATRFKANPERWLFLTGKKKEIYRLAQEGFHLSAVPVADKNNDIILHSSRFVLVDGKAQIRGYYDSGDTQALERLRLDLRMMSTDVS